MNKFYCLVDVKMMIVKKMDKFSKILKVLNTQEET